MAVPAAPAGWRRNSLRPAMVRARTAKPGRWLVTENHSRHGTCAQRARAKSTAGTTLQASHRSPRRPRR